MFEEIFCRDFLNNFIECGNLSSIRKIQKLEIRQNKSNVSKLTQVNGLNILK